VNNSNVLVDLKYQYCQKNINKIMAAKIISDANVPNLWAIQIKGFYSMGRGFTDVVKGIKMPNTT